MKTTLRTGLVIIAFVFAAHAQDRPAATRSSRCTFITCT